MPPPNPPPRNDPPLRVDERLLERERDVVRLLPVRDAPAALERRTNDGAERRLDAFVLRTLRPEAVRRPVDLPVDRAYRVLFTTTVRVWIGACQPP